MAEFKVLNILDKTILEQESFTPSASRSCAVWPSEASAELIDKTAKDIVGKCHRASYYRMIGWPVNTSIDAVGAWRFVIGRLVETHVTDLAKISDPTIWVANGVKLFVKDIGLSLEMDIIVKDPVTHKGWILECKTFYGAFAKRDLIGVYGKPKLEHVMQICMYLLEAKNGANLKKLIKDSLKDREVLDLSGKSHRNRVEASLDLVELIDDGPVGGKLVYLSRDEGDRVEFDIAIEQSEDGFHYPTVNGLAINSFTIESIYERYKTLQNYWYVARNRAVDLLKEKGIFPPPKLKLILSSQDLQNQQEKAEQTDLEESEIKIYLAALEAQVRALPDSYLPPAEYEFAYPDHKIERLYKIGEISPSKYNNWKATKTNKPLYNKDGKPSKRKVKPTPRIGDWQCLHPDTAIIMSDRNIKPISKIVEGEVTAKGKVLKVMSKSVDRKMVQVKPYNLPWMQLTSDHKCKVGSRWIEASKLNAIDHYLEVPFDQTEKTVHLTFNDLFVIGLWTAEGWYHHLRPDGGYYKVGFTIHPKEEMAAEAIKTFAKQFTNKNGEQATVTDRFITDKRNGNKYRYLRINSKDAANFICNWTIGNSANSKAIAKTLMVANKRQQLALLAGLISGDGCVTQMRTTHMNVYSTVSNQLAFDVQQILWRQGQVAGITTQINKTGYRPGSICNHVRWYETSSHRSYISNGVFYTKIHKLLDYKYEGDVWDLEIEATHQIPTVSGIVHNCGYCSYRNTCIPKQSPELAYQVYDLQNALDEETEVEFSEE